MYTYSTSPPSPAYELQFPAPFSTTPITVTGVLNPMELMGLYVISAEYEKCSIKFTIHYTADLK